MPKFKKNTDLLSKKRFSLIKTFFVLSLFVLFVFASENISALPGDGDEASCFLPGTPIQMQDGTIKNIEDVEVGEEVVGYDIGKKEFTKNIVLETEMPVRSEWFKVFLENGKVLRTTDDHPIYVKEIDGWVSIDPEATWENSNHKVRTKQLKAGQNVMDLNGKYSEILYILNIPEEVQTIEDVYELFLLQIGMLERTPRGRKVTRRAYEHLKIPIID